MYMFTDAEKLMICTIGKVGYRDFRDLVNKMHIEKGTEYRIRYLLDKKWNEEANKLVEDPTVHKAIFYRDPLERFLSAYMSLCEGEDTTEFRFCKVAFGDEKITFADAVMQMPGKSEDTLSAPLKPQHTHCGGITRELLDKSFTTKQQLIDPKTTKIAVKQMLSKFELTDKEFEKYYPMKYARDFATGARDKLMEHYGGKNIKLVAVVIKYYLQDYLVFDMKVPLYAQKALQQLRFDKSPFALSDKIMAKLNVPLKDPDPPPPTQAPTRIPKSKRQMMMAVRKKHVSVAQLVHPSDDDEHGNSAAAAASGGGDSHPNMIVAAVCLFNLLIVVTWCWFFRRRISAFVNPKRAANKKSQSKDSTKVSAAINRRRRRRRN